MHRPAVVALPVAALVLAACASQPAGDTPSPETAPRTLAWTQGPVLPKGRDHHVTWIVPASGGARLYVAGGTDYRGMFNDVWRLALDAQGQPTGEWVEAGTLPSRRAGQGVATDGRWVVLVAGQDSTLRKRTETWIARVQPDGALGEWATGPALPSPKFHHTLVLHRGWLYAVGGLETNTSSDAGFRASFKDGVVGEWQPLAPTPEPRSHHSAFVVGDTLYLAGGLNGNPAGKNVPLTSVIAATVGRDGALSPWREAGQLTPAVATHASTAANGVVWTVGGVEENARFSSAVWRAETRRPLAADAWARDSTGLPAASSHVHQMPVFAGKLYRVGGGARRQVTGNTLIAPVR